MMSPSDYAKHLTQQSEDLYASYSASSEPTMVLAEETDPRICVYDSVLADPVTYQRAALASQPQTYVVGNVSWHGLSECVNTEFVEWLANIRPDLTPTLSLIRQSPLNQVEPNFIHTDRDMGDWTAILYLTESPEAEDGTDFWRHRWSGATDSSSLSSVDSVHEAMAWKDATQWSHRLHVSAAFNRAVIFPASCFHSRAIFENYGFGETSRLTQVVFCKKKA